MCIFSGVRLCVSEWCACVYVRACGVRVALQAGSAGDPLGNECMLPFGHLLRTALT